MGMNRNYLLTMLLALLVAGCCTQSANAQDNRLKANINHLAIFVVDLQKSGNFYQNIIGLDTISEPFHDGKHIWMRIGLHAALHIIQGADAPIKHLKNNHICFSVPSVRAFTAKLKEYHIKWEDVSGKEEGITRRPDGILQIWLQDPDGYWIEINDDRS